MLARTLTQAALPSTVGCQDRALADRRARRRRAVDRATAVAARPGRWRGGNAGRGHRADRVGRRRHRTERRAGRFAAVGACRRPGTPPGRRSPASATRWSTCCDAWGHIAADVATGSRPEIGELAEGRGGGSSTMPHKNNPVRSVLIRRAALTAGPLGATLHAAAAASVDERSDGALARRMGHPANAGPPHRRRRCPCLRAVSGLRVDAARAAANLAAADGLLSEQRAMTELTGRAALSGYTGATDQLIDSTLQPRAPLRQGGLMTIPRLIGIDFGGPDGCAAAAARTVPRHLGGDAVERRGAERLAEHVRVVGWDLPGHGRRPAPSRSPMAELAAGGAGAGRRARRRNLPLRR